jgi:twitching motility protein PilT
MPMIDHEQLLRFLAERGGSDLHLKVGSPPLVRLDGILHRVGDVPVTSDDADRISEAIMPQHRVEELRGKNEADFAYSMPGVGRFRVNVFRQRGSISVAMRRIRIGSPSFEELGLPPIVGELSEAQRGLVLVTGPTGSGKTTTLAAMIDHINSVRPCHILTVEDPIEVLHKDNVAVVNQREIGVDTADYLTALRAAMREDPDVVLIGEMRDMETVAAALAAAETGHFVLSTLHTIDATETVNRIVDFFPPYQQHQIRITLAGSLRGIICQRLVPRSGGGRVPAAEICVNNGRVADRIIDPDMTSEIAGIIAESGFYGMQTFDQSLLGLVQSGLIHIDDAMTASSRPHDFTLMLEQAGIRAPSAA